MTVLTIRDLPDDVHRALRVRAGMHGRSTAAEVREILRCAVKPEARTRVGDALCALGRELNLTNEDCEIFDQVRNRVPAEPMRLT